MSQVCSSTAEKYLRLHLCEDVGAIRSANLLRELGGIDAVLAAPLNQLRRVDQVGEKTASNIVRDRNSDRAQEELQIAADEGVRILCIEDDEYPIALKNISDPPLCLYFRGTLQREDAVALGIVGSRTCSRYGAEQAERLAGLAAGAGLTIVSGMARGIDTYAHRGALAAGRRTIAVLGCGLCHVYPEESTDLAQRIAANGAILSELPMRISPDSVEWLRLPGDIIFIAGGAVPALYIAYLGVRHTVKRVTLDEPDDILFTELSVPGGVAAAGGDEATAARLT